MFLNNLFESPREALPGYESEKDDNSTMKLNDFRKGSRLTFAHLNQLRMANDVRKFEHEKKLETVKKQYAVAPEGGDLGAAGLGGL